MITMMAELAWKLGLTAKGMCSSNLDYLLYHLTLQHYWWSSWYWNLKIQVDDKLHECLWSPKGHYTQSPTVHCSRPPDDQRWRYHGWIHFAPALVDQKSELCICECMCVYVCICDCVWAFICTWTVHVASYLTSWLDKHNRKFTHLIFTSMHACHCKSKIVVLSKHLVTAVVWLSLLCKLYECNAGSWELMQL